MATTDYREELDQGRVKDREEPCDGTFVPTTKDREELDEGTLGGHN